MICQGLPGNTYDLYVLGLLGKSERTELDRHIQNQCEDCIRGVQRSMRLWTVFTSSLSGAEPSEDFRARLLEIVDLSKSVLTFPKDSAVAERSRRTRPISLTLAALLAGVLALSGWYAGHTSAALDRQNLTAQLAQKSRELELAQLKSNKLQQNSGESPAAATGEGGAVVRDERRLGRRLSESEAALNQYKSLLDRQQRALDNRTDILNLLSSAGTRLLSLKATPPSQIVGYVVVVPNARLALICSNMPGLPRGREYQLWVQHGNDRVPVNGGVFVPDRDSRAYVQIDDGSIVSEISSLTVTDEPAGGSALPTGTRLLNWNCEQGDLARCSS